MKFEDVETLCNAVEQAEMCGSYADGYVTIPAYLLEIMHNALFPTDQRHEYTEV